MIKIGLSVPMGIFTNTQSGSAAEYIRAFGGKEEFLDFCGKEFDSAEIRSVKSDCNPSILAKAVRILKSRGLSVTIHGTLDEDFFAPYYELFSAGLQNQYTITVHPLSTPEKTVKCLSKICKEIDVHGFPVKIALENQRLKEGNNYGTCADVAKVAAQVNSKNLSLCFDFGHQLNNEKSGTEPAPTDAFLTQLIHTHIHSLDARTHYPLNVGECLLDRNITELLSLSYDEVLNLELSPERYCDKHDVKTSLIKSAQILKFAAHQVSARLAAKAFYINDYENTIKQAMAEFNSADNIAVLIGPSAYVIKLHGVSIAVDVSPKILPINDTAKRLIQEWISGFDAIIATHSHSDHYDREFITALPSSVKKIIPDFLELNTAGQITVTDGSSLEIGSITLNFFNGAHFFNGNGVREYGFAIETDGAHYVFTVDARDYSFEYPHFKNVRALFTHLWLGRGTALRFEKLYTDEFCRFAKSFGAQHIYTAHLVETSRNIDNMWSDIHLNLIKKQIPDIIAPAIGQLIHL